MKLSEAPCTQKNKEAIDKRKRKQEKQKIPARILAT